MMMMLYHRNNKARDVQIEENPPARRLMSCPYYYTDWLLAGQLYIARWTLSLRSAKKKKINEKIIITKKERGTRPGRRPITGLPLNETRQAISTKEIAFA
jgi:hypothetical protein